MFRFTKKKRYVLLYMNEHRKKKISLKIKIIFSRQQVVTTVLLHLAVN